MDFNLQKRDVEECCPRIQSQTHKEQPENRDASEKESLSCLLACLFTFVRLLAKFARIVRSLVRWFAGSLVLSPTRRRRCRYTLPVSLANSHTDTQTDCPLSIARIASSLLLAYDKVYIKIFAVAVTDASMVFAWLL